MKKEIPCRDDFLKQIYSLSQKAEVRGADLVDELDVKRPTVCIHLKRLMDIGDELHCVRLTEQGLAIVESTPGKHASAPIHTPH